MNERPDVRLIEFTEHLPVGGATQDHVAIYNEHALSDDQIRELIQTGAWRQPNDFVIFIIKEQYENIFGSLPETSEEVRPE